MKSNHFDTEDTRSRIIDAALDLFSENGFHATTTRKIAIKAGVNEVTLFRHFKKKIVLFQEILDEIKKLGFDSEAIKDISVNPEDAIRYVVESIFEIVETHPREVRLINLAILEGVDGFEQGFVEKSSQDTLKFLTDTFKELQVQKKITSEEKPEILAHMLFSQVTDMALQRTVRKHSSLKDFDRTTLSNSIIRLFMS